MEEPVKRDYYSTDEVATILGVTTDTVRRWCRSGSMAAYQVQEGGVWRIKKEVLNARISNPIDLCEMIHMRSTEEAS